MADNSQVIPVPVNIGISCSPIPNDLNSKQLIIAEVSTSKSHIVKPKIKRSKNGCFSCKKLKIKCNEAKPICEYCRHTSRACVYPSLTDQDRVKAKKSRDKNRLHQGNPDVIRSITRKIASSMEINNKQSQSLNSMLQLMDVSKLELKLLRLFLDFGGEFFSFNVNSEVHEFWSNVIPGTWRNSELLKSALYSISSLMLWTFYELNNITNVYLEEDQSVIVYDDENRTSTSISLYKHTDNYFQRTLQLLRQYSAEQAYLSDVEISGHIIAVNVIIFAFLSVHPISPVALVSHRDSHAVDLLDMCRNFHQAIYFRYSLIQGTKYESSLYPNERQITTDGVTSYKFIDHLKQYIDSTVDALDSNHLTFYACIYSIESGCYRSTVLNYIMPLFRNVIDIARDMDYVNLLKSKNYTAIKLMFYYSCACSISGFKLFYRESIWDSFISDFKKLSFELFNGQFEDSFDTRMYEAVQFFRNFNYPFRLEMLRTVGTPTFLDSLKASTFQKAGGNILGVPLPV